MKKRISRRRFIELSAGTAATAPAFGETHAFAQTAATTMMTLDGKGSGHQFQKSKATGTKVDQWPNNRGTNQQRSIVSA